MIMPISPGDIISLLKLGWGGVSGLWKFVRRNKRKLTPQQKLELRVKWKPQFADYLTKLFMEQLRGDVIIRDMRRMDTYPHISKGKGISSWFRCGLLDTYERGIMVGLRWEGITKVGESYRYGDWKNGEEGELKVLLTGYIPFENIESVDWDGDGYYDYPHIYCYFTFSGEPYERVVFCTKRQNPGGRPFYSEIVDAASVIKVSKKFGITR